MGKSYAGVLGLLACGMILARGLIAGGGLESTIVTASAALFGFAALGWIAGQLAQRFIDESVRNRFQAALASLEVDQKKAKTTAT
jgi:C4-dicarboxylate transporter